MLPDSESNLPDMLLLLPDILGDGLALADGSVGDCVANVLLLPLELFLLLFKLGSFLLSSLCLGQFLQITACHYLLQI